MIVLYIVSLITSPIICGNDSNITIKFGNRILNGLKAEDFQFPYQISLQFNKKHICGGSIISDKKVLTAGHCVTDGHGIMFPTDQLRILAGTNKLNVKQPKYFYSVKGVAIHPKFDLSNVHYDYAIVFINGHFDFQSTKLSIIPLATENPRPGTVCYLSGWGDVEKGAGTSIPNDLQFARIVVDPPTICGTIYGQYFLPVYMLCAGQSNRENAGCGDSGGPLCCNNELSGIVSFGRNYDDPRFPDVYSSVAFAFQWVNSTEETANGSMPRATAFNYSVMMLNSVFLTHVLLSILN